ncbi:Deoxyribodipyrimidine photo-lyase, putative [Perkinsus marinus ATCC 50983]|uniref:Deoxyribodipyrimidine photo-lyase n=1 Tax=Perkinsus marinus (strain ATCC 50983 / TXsc) TaxID=423536 RepID=C5KJA9_PERM5|nr:Deoxyribodipyrimidine photo-lyase, putative [Perkinsus marinus ATCC 50983]EER15411.1 Deoxyribodipyrimidine photo-lyase, putative [Perkinsus marinus ATCC 50983]|eukprot:XP_002783615.1 Deoxyribodipyrimidine photo-lyase, putative [Perkinsus marinus ATCC 50983]
MPQSSVSPDRIRVLNQPATGLTSPGPVIYWMSREIRSRDNWALIHAQNVALRSKRPLLVVYNLAVGYLGGGLRQHAFKVGGLKVVAANLSQLNIPFAIETSPKFPALLADITERVGCKYVVTDFTPLRLNKEWVAAFTKHAKRLDIRFELVDAHNVVPCWVTSDKMERAAVTIRPKLWHHFDEFCTKYPRLKRHAYTISDDVHFHTVTTSEIEALLTNDEIVGKLDKAVEPIDWLTPGEDAGLQLALGYVKNLPNYSTQRNNPTNPIQSDLSPYFHYGFVSPQRVIYDAYNSTDINEEDRDEFIEQCMIRRELADNFCYYNDNYDKFEGFPDWGQHTLREHAKDDREYLYSLEQLENADTHDRLWNATQRQMVETGKIHGYMRMYWCKKILEWTKSPEEALEFSIYLNDKYELDGRDPNGYVGIAWCIGGRHDRPFGERNVYGVIRYMSYNGCRGKFDINKYMKMAGSVEGHRAGKMWAAAIQQSVGEQEGFWESLSEEERRLKGR